MQESPSGNLIAESDEEFGRLIREKAIERATSLREERGDAAAEAEHMELKVRVYFADPDGEAPQHDMPPEPTCVCVANNGLMICRGETCRKWCM
jgi:hypothetical protein